MITQVLILNHQLMQTVTLKQALERTGLYSAHPFTAADTAIEYLRAHPQQVALVDLELPGIRGDELIARLREAQPDLPIIVSPLLDRNTVTQLRLQGTLKANFSARDVLPLLEEYSVSAEDADQEAPQLIDRPATAPSLRTRLLNNPTRDVGATRSIEQPEERQPIATEGFDTTGSQPVSRPTVMPKMATTDSLGEVPDDKPGTNRLTDVLDHMADPSGYSPDEALRDMDAASEKPAEAPDIPHSDLLSRLDLSGTPADQPVTTDQRFTDLVNSMRRGDDQRKSLPQRSQPFVDFILTGGMDTLLTEIERSKGSTQPIEADSAFTRLAKDEPPLPTLEESGTVSDLMTGVSDPGFRNVLAMLSGEQTESQSEADDSPEMSADEIESAFSSYFLSNDRPRTSTAPLPPRTAPLPSGTAPLEQPPSVPEERTPARLILETALDESTPIDSFSLENLIASIDEQLPSHRPNVQPLPSWVRESNVNFALSQPQIEEPDFLAGNTALFAPADDIDFSFANTQPSSAAQPEADAYDFVTDSYEVSARTQPIGARAEPPEPPDIFAEEDVTPAHEQPVAAEDATQSFERPPELPVLRPPVEASWLDLDMIDQLNLLEDYEQETVPHPVGEQPLDPRFERLLNMGDLEEETSTPLPPRPVRKPVRPPAPPPVEPPETTPEAAPVYAEEPQEPERLPDLWPEEAEEPAVAAELPPVYEPVYEPEYEPSYEPVYEIISAAPVPVVEAPIEDEQVSQLALSLTQASLELTADATLLTRGRDVVAAAGALAPEDIVELRRVIKDDWEAGGDDARMRFVTLPSSGKDYLVYSRRTIDDLTLTMLFSGTKPLRDIRRQERRLLEALEAVPEKPAPVPTIAPEPEPRTMTTRTVAPVVKPPVTTPAIAATLSDEVESVTRTPYAAVWLVRDPNMRLSESVARAISSGLRAQLGAQSWTVQDLAAQDEFVYVRADVPGEAPPPEIIRDLKRRSAQIAASLDPSLPASELWSDSYLVVTSGQPLDDEDIQQFINFERME